MWTQHLESSYKVFNVHVEEERIILQVLNVHLEEERIIQQYDINICRIILQYACVYICRERESCFDYFSSQCHLQLT